MVDGGAEAVVRPHLRHLPSLRDPRVHILMSGSRLQQAAFTPEPVPLGDLAVAWQQDPALEGVVRKWWDWLPRPKCWMVQWAEWRWLNVFLCEELAPTLAGLESFAESAAALDYLRLAPASFMDYQGFAVGMLEIACNFSPSCEARGEAQWLDQLLVRLQRKREVAAAAGVNTMHENQPALMAAGNEVFSEPRCGGHSPEGPRALLPDLTADLAPPFERAQPARAQACQTVAPRIETCSSGISVREARPQQQAQARNGHILFGFTAPKSAASKSLLAKALQKAPLESWSGRKLDNWREAPDEHTKAANSGISGRVLQPATSRKRTVMTHTKGSNRDPNPPNCARSSFGSAEAPEFRKAEIGYRTSGISDDPDEIATPGHGRELRLQLGMGMKWSQQRGNQCKLVLSRARPRSSTYRWPRQIEPASGSPLRTPQITGIESRSPHGRRPSSADPLLDAVSELVGDSTVIGQSLVSSRPENTTPIVPRPQSATGSISFSGVSEARRNRPSTSLGFYDHDSPLGYRPISCWPALSSRAPSATGRKARQTAKTLTAVHASQSNSIRPVWQNPERGKTPEESFPTVPAARLHYLQNNNDAHHSHNGAETQVQSPESNFRSLIGTPSSMISVRVEHASNLLNRMKGSREIEVRVPSRQDAFTRVSQVVPVEGASLKTAKSADSHDKSAMIQGEGLSLSTVAPARGDDVNGVQKQDSGEKDGSGLENGTSQVLPIAAPGRNTLSVVAMDDLNPESLENLRGLFGRYHQEKSLSSNSITTYDEMRLQLLDKGSLAQSLLGDVLLSRQLSSSFKRVDGIPSASNVAIEASPDSRTNSELSEQLHMSPYSSLYAQHQQKQDKRRQAKHSSEDIGGRVFDMLPVAEDGTEIKWELVERPSPRQHGDVSGEEGSLSSESDQYG